MAQTTRPQTPSGAPASGGAPGATARPPARSGAPISGRAPAPGTPGKSATPGRPGAPVRPGGPGRPGGRAAPLRPASGGWRGAFSGLDREHTRERLAVVLLSAVIALCVLLVGGALVWDRVIVPHQPVARLDGRSITLQEYTDTLSYRQNVLMSEYEQAQQLAMQPTPAAGSGGDDFLRQYAQQRLSAIQNQMAGLTTQLVDDLVGDRLIRAEAARRGISATPQEIDAELKAMIGYQDASATPVPAAGATPAVTPDAAATAPATAPATAAAPARRQQDFDTVFRNYRRATAGTDSVVRGDAEMQILRRKLSEQLSAAVPATAEQIHARHILLPDETAAAAVQERLKSGESFEAIAAELSTDPGSKAQGGDLGWFPRGFMISAFEDAAFKLAPGQVSDPVKTSFGVHLIRVDERSDARPLDPEQLQALQNNALPRWLDEEKAKHKVEYLLSPEQQDWASRNIRQPSFARS